MYFIYPASVSENCDKRIVPAIAKCIERFFLLQIEDAMTSGVLPLSRKWNGKNYGPLLLECVNNYNKKQMLTENNILLEATGGGGHGGGHGGGAPRGPSPHYEEYRKEVNSIKFSRDMEKEDLEEILSQIDSVEDKVRNDDTIQPKEQKDIESMCKNLRSRVQRLIDNYDDENDSRIKDHSVGGSYIPMQTKIDIVPTCGSVNVDVLYVGGQKNNDIRKNIEVNINVKVIPTIIKNFKQLEYDLLNDYFSKKSESAFKTIGRNVARSSYNAIKKLPFGMGDFLWKKGMELAGEDVDSESRKDIIYQTQGFVNASAFHKSGSSPNNYNYTSNIVIFNKDDLTDPDDQNIFMNRSAMVRLFKMGWSTFCMLDPVEEMMYFISSLDGGYMHVIPYRYIMESYGSKAYYGDEKKLKDSAKPFMIKRGGFGEFAKMFKKR